jgi:hypothetical protein
MKKERGRGRIMMMTAVLVPVVGLTYEIIHDH